MKAFKNLSRRNFLLGLAHLSGAAVVPSLIACTKQPGQTTSPQRALPQLPGKTGPLRISIQGSFAIFIGQNDVMVYAPKVDTHSYRVTDGLDDDSGDPGNSRWDLGFFKTPDLDLTKNITPGTPPKFDSTAPSGSNTIDTTINPVFTADKVYRPVNLGEYLFSIKLPLPTRVRSQYGVGKNPGPKQDFFNQPKFQLQDLARTHVFEYDTYDPANVQINNFLVQFFPGEERLKFLSEPVDQNAAITDCLNHTQKASQALGDMLHLQGGIYLNENYCAYTEAKFARLKHKSDTHSKHNKDGGGVDPHSRMPACMSLLVNDTGTGVGSVINP